jgi:hypothetical protein
VKHHGDPFHKPVQVPEYRFEISPRCPASFPDHGRIVRGVAREGVKGLIPGDRSIKFEFMIYHLLERP